MAHGGNNSDRLRNRNGDSVNAFGVEGVNMTTDERIAELKMKCADLQEQLNIAYDDLDSRIGAGNSDRLTVYGIIVALVIGGIQIAIGVIALLK